MYCHTSSSVQLRQREHAQVLARPRRARCRGPTARAAGAAGPSCRSRRAARSRAPSRASAPRRAARRRSRRRSGSPRSRRAASSSAAGCARRAARLLAHAPAVDRLLHRGDEQPSPSSATRRSRNSITSGKLWPVSTCSSGNGTAPGANAFSASRSSTIESLPPENSSAGRSRSAATSRMTWIASASSARGGERGRPSVTSLMGRAARTRSCRGPPSGPRGPLPGCVQCVQPIEAYPWSCSGWYGRSRSTMRRHTSLLGPVGERVELPQPVLLVPLDLAARPRASATARGACR